MKRLFSILAGVGLALGGLWRAEAADERFVSQSVRRAGFVPGVPSDLFPAPSSQFNGLISSVDGVVPDESGYFKITVYSSGYYTGTMYVGTRQVHINGYFNPDGTATTSIYNVYHDDCCYSYYYLAWVIDFTIIPGTDEIQGLVRWLGSGPWQSELLGYRSGPWNNQNPTPFVGRYTIRLPGSTEPAVAPAGDGYVTVSMNNKGYATLSGALADGTRFTRSSLISTNGYLPFSVPSNAGLGIMIGWFVFDLAPARDISGELVWIKPAQFNATYYPSGFQGTVVASGGPYITPSDSHPALSWTNGILVATDGNLPSPLANRVTLSPTGKLTNRGGTLTNLTFALNRNTGIFNGRFRDPQSGKYRNYYGALFQNEDIGGGYFLGSNQGGQVQLRAAPLAVP